MKRRTHRARPTPNASSQRAWEFSGLCGTWNRGCAASTLASVVRARLATVSFATAGLATACSFPDFSKTSPPPDGPVVEPACLRSNELLDAGMPAPIAHWTFNEAQTDGHWPDRNGMYPLVARADESPGAVVPQLAAGPRINGEGQSVNLDGHQYLRAVTTADELLPEQFTIAAWISLPARAFTSDGVPFAWPILSTLGDDQHCDGYQLEIRFGGAPNDPELVLSHQVGVTTGDAGTSECQVSSLHAPLEVPSWATGAGRWHHVAGTLAQLGNGRAQLALYWDGKRIQLQDPLESPPEGAKPSQAGERVFVVGASALDAESAAQTKFTGYVDDVAIFDKPLTEQELKQFVLGSTTRPGPSNCRWRASEQWDKQTAFKPSYTTWLSSSSEALSVEIDDQDWGAGALDARIEPPRDIQLYDRAYLEGDFPKGQGFQFTLASGDNYCTWTYLGRGADTYEIDLTRPVSCVSTTCQVNFHRVDRASVTSEWTIPGDGNREPGIETFIVRRLEFALAKGAPPGWTSCGGVYGLLGYCWRLQAYEPETMAHWRQKTALWSDSMSATLTGPTNSGTRVMADFGERGLDIENCERASIDALLAPTGSGSMKYALAVQDVHGSWLSYDLRQDPNTGEYHVDNFDNPSSKSESDQKFERFPQIDKRRIRLLGLQKPWGYPGSLEIGSLDVTIRNLSLLPVGCERPGSH